MALVVWASAVFAGWKSLHKLLAGSATSHVGAGIVAAALGIVGNQLVARYKLRVGRSIQSATLVSDAKHSWLDALSSAGALAGLVAVAAGQRWGDPVAGLAVTLFICLVGWEVTTDIGHRLLDGVDPSVITTAEHAATAVPGVRPRPRPRPLDRPHPTHRDRSLGQPRPARRHRRPARPPDRRGGPRGDTRSPGGHRHTPRHARPRLTTASRDFTADEGQSGENWSHGVEQAVKAALVGRYYERFYDHAVAISRQ